MNTNNRLFIWAIIVLMLMPCISVNAQNEAQARKILNKTASVIGNRGGASANFSISNSKIGSTAGTIAIKGNKFHARTPQSIVWFNGKTQWTYMKKTNEVNVSTPSQAQQMSMNPYTFINMYKSGYNISMKGVGGNHQIHLVAQNKKRSIQELYITINAKSYTPSQIKMRQGTTWSTINISNFKSKNVSNDTFVFNSKDFPKAEVVDLR